MPGLFFIALNRILAPAFYAQSDTKSPTLAGVISFAINIILAVILVQPFRGSGIAAALSIASAGNTIILFIFLKKNSNINLGPSFQSMVLYTLKLLVLSGIAAVPLYFLTPHLLELFADRGRVIAYGAPLAINAFVFATLGIILLVLTKDKQLKALLMVLRKTR